MLDSVTNGHLVRARTLASLLEIAPKSKQQALVEAVITALEDAIRSWLIELAVQTDSGTLDSAIPWEQVALDQVGEVQELMQRVNKWDDPIAIIRRERRSMFRPAQPPVVSRPNRAPNYKMPAPKEREDLIISSTKDSESAPITPDKRDGIETGGASFSKDELIRWIDSIALMIERLRANLDEH